MGRAGKVEGGGSDGKTKRKYGGGGGLVTW